MYVYYLLILCQSLLSNSPPPPGGGARFLGRSGLGGGARADGSW